MLVIEVPQIALTFSHLDVVSRNSASLLQYVLYVGFAAVFMVLFIMLAATVHYEVGSRVVCAEIVCPIEQNRDILMMK